MKKVTFEELQLRNRDLEGQVAAHQKQRMRDETKLRNAATFTSRARVFADAYHAHPWVSRTVYEAGQDLIKAVREVQ